MIRVALFLVISALPLRAQEPASPPGGVTEGVDLLQRGMQSILDGFFTEMQSTLDGMGQAIADLRPMAEQLMRLVDDIGNYEAPVILENGDILIRRKPDPPVPPKAGEIDL